MINVKLTHKLLELDFYELMIGTLMIFDPTRNEKQRGVFLKSMREKIYLCVLDNKICQRDENYS